MKQIERIEHMEQNMERAMHAVRVLDDALNEYEAAQEALHELESYYGSDTWKQDFTDDEAGKFPADLRRGVLSEDGIWNLLSDARELVERLHSIV